MRCCIPACRNSVTCSKAERLFGIPSKNNLKHLWVKAIKINSESITENTKVCQLHFREEDFFYFSTKMKLKTGVIPSLNLNNEPEVLVHVENVLETRKRRRKSKVRFVARQTKIVSSFSVERFRGSDKKILYYTGLPSWQIFLVVFNFIYDSDMGPVVSVQQEQNKKKFINRRHKLTPKNEFFLTLMKLRRGFDYETLADMFQLSQSAVGRIFLAWIDILYEKLAGLNVFPHRDVLLNKVSDTFKQKYPNVIGSIDCTEFILQTPSSLVRQSQCYSQYKGSTTLKSLIMISGSGAVIFVSALYTGSISDKKIVQDSGFLNLLKKKVELGELKNGDVILADKGFEIKNILEDVGISLNIPTFRITGIQFQPKEINYIGNIAKERIHVERAIRRIKSFKILSHKIPICLLGSINQIYTVCTLLTNFLHELKKS